MDLAVQAYTFAVMLVTGALLGLVFDCYRVAGSMLRVRGSVTFVLDLLYWVVATCIALASLVLCNWLELRLYVFLGLAGGAVSYYRCLSRYIMALLLRLAVWGGRLFAWTSRAVWFVVIRPFGLVMRLLLLPLVKVRQPAVHVWRKVKQWEIRQKKPPL